MMVNTMKSLPQSLRLLFALVALSGVAGPLRAQARAGDIEYYGVAGYRSGDHGQLQQLRNIRFDIDHIWTFGGGGGYFLTDQLSVVSDLDWGYSNLRLSDSRTPGGPSYTQTANYFDGRLNLELTPFAGPISPFVTGGIGFSNIETAIPGALPQVYCTPGVVYWWCASGVPSFSETAFTYNVGIGGRLDLTPSFFVKLMYTSTWADLSGFGTRRSDQVRLQIGGRLKGAP
jgi:opacity protein-like surface antigen